MSDTPITHGDAILNALADGPLTPEEATRRAQVAFFNHMAQIYDENAVMAKNDMLHPETRQVAARTADLAMEVARSLSPEGFVSAAITLEELERLRDVLDDAWSNAESLHWKVPQQTAFADTDRAEQIRTAQVDVARWIAAATS